jgi:UDP-N-acetylglucosamine 3-dehydrogenase
MTPLRIGIIGCGWAGDKHARAVRQVPDRMQVHGVADIDPRKAQVCAREWQVPVWTADYAQLLDPGHLDAVSICLPHQLHAPVAIAAAQAGLHVLVEKPLATTLDEADAMIAAADTAGVQLMVAENVRFDNSYIKAAQLIASGALGDLFLVRIAREHQMHAYLRQRPWFLQEPSAGIMYSGGVHDLELLRLLAGEIRHIFGFAGPKALPEMAADDTSVALAELQSGVIATIVESFSLRTSTPGVHGTAHGSLGSMWFHQDRIRLYNSPMDGQSNQVSELVIPQRDTFQAEIEHFCDCIETGAEPITSGREQRKPLAAVLAAYASFRTGQRITLAE